MTLPLEQFSEWWTKHEHAEAITASEAWLCIRYREAWQASRQDDDKTAPHWWERYL